MLVWSGGLQAQTGMGKLKTKINPSRAGIFVDGKYVGPAANFTRSRSYNLPAGTHEVRLSEPRYQDLVRTVTITAGQTLVLKEKLTAVPLAQPPFGLLRTEHVDKYAAVYINGKFFGHVDEFSNFAQGIKINPGEYDVRIEPLSKGEVRAARVIIRKGETTVLK